jgi:hypothetical protein
MKFRHAMALCSLVLATSAFAADPALKQLDMFAHTWQCSGTMTIDGPPIHYTATVTGTWVLGGNWLDVRVTQARTKENPKPYNGRAYIGYDAAAKKFVMSWIDITGGYQSAEFTGWQGDTLVWEGMAHMGPITAMGRDTFTRSGAKKLTHTFELQQSGKWIEQMKESCTR